jgi:hypothetical protein
MTSFLQDTAKYDRLQIIRHYTEYTAAPVNKGTVLDTLDQAKKLLKESAGLLQGVEFAPSMPSDAGDWACALCADACPTR